MKTLPILAAVCAAALCAAIIPGGVKAQDELTFTAPAGAPDPDRDPPGKTDPPPEGIVEPPARDITGRVGLTDKDTGRRVGAKPGNIIRVELPANRTTGYNWEVRDFEQGVLEMLGADYIAPEGQNPFFAGAPGTTVFEFFARRPGVQDINAVYRRPWEEPEQIAGRFSARIVVEDPAAAATSEAAPTPEARPAASPDGTPSPAPTPRP